MAVHQLVPHFRLGDETARAAVQLRALLRRLGHWGGLYAASQERGTEALVQPVTDLRVRPKDWVLLHHGAESRLPSRLLHLPCHRGVVFHGLPSLRLEHGTSMERTVLAAKAQLSGMAAHVSLGIGLSGFASAELSRAGYREVHTVPPFVEAERFAPERADPALRARFTSSDALTLVSVGPLTREGRLEDVLALHREVLRVRPDARLIVAGPVEAGLEAVAADAARVPGVTMLGRVSHAEKVAVYRSGSVLVSMREHAGSAVELLEAMAADLP
ncbi:MAG TPA: glycosyltransferase, partial [Solirubrobacteraceae bacterium]